MYITIFILISLIQEMFYDVIEGFYLLIKEINNFQVHH